MGLSLGSSRQPAGVRESALPDPPTVKILAVDDRLENLVALEAVLQAPGYEIVMAQSGMEALRHLLEDEFAVILLDVMMPGMDGFETAELIRQRDRFRHTPILFLTAINKSEEHVFRGYELGAVDYLFKPIVPQVLRSKVAVFVELSRQRELLRRHSSLLETKNRELEEAMLGLRQAEQEIKRLNIHLERRLIELSEAYRELDAFSYSVSHDLRAPLRRIEGFGRALMDRAAHELDEESKTYIESIRSNSHRMSQLIEDLLKLSRLSRADVTRQAVDLSDMARSLAGDLYTRKPGRNVDFDVANGISAPADPGLIRIALANLMENAWKFTSPNARARIEFGRIDHDRETVLFVRDNGIGFEMELASRLFAPFQRLHSSSEFEGTGIGLATVKRIIQRHGGRIWAESAPGKGATFYFTVSPAGSEGG
jgi:signal transduction histidine kinase